MEENKTFYCICPKCGEISGFYLPSQAIKENEAYYCHECGNETKLSKWKKSTELDYKYAHGIIDSRKRFCGGLL